MDCHSRLISSTYSSSKISHSSESKYTIFLQSNEYYHFIDARLDETYIKADYIIKFLSHKYLPSPPPHFNYPHVYHDKYFSVFDLNLPCVLESEFQYMYMSLLSFIVYTKPAYYFISEGEICGDRETNEQKCKRVIINVGLLSLFARSMDIEKDDDIPEVLMAMLALFGQFFSIKQNNPDSNKIFDLFPEESIFFTMYLLISQNNNNTSFETFKQTANIAFKKVDTKIATPHKRLFMSCYKKNLKDTLTALKKIFPFQILRKRLIDFVDTIYESLLTEINEKIQTNQMDELPLKENYLKLSNEQLRELTIAEQYQGIYTERILFRSREKADQIVQTDETYDFPTRIIFKESKPEIIPSINELDTTNIDVTGILSLSEKVSKQTQTLISYKDKDKVSSKSYITQTDDSFLNRPKLVDETVQTVNSNKSISVQTDTVNIPKTRQMSTQTEELELVKVNCCNGNLNGTCNARKDADSIAIDDKEAGTENWTQYNVDQFQFMLQNRLLRQLLKMKEDELSQKTKFIESLKPAKEEELMVDEMDAFVPLVEKRDKRYRLIEETLEKDTFEKSQVNISSLLKGETMELDDPEFKAIMYADSFNYKHADKDKINDIEGILSETKDFSVPPPSPDPVLKKFAEEAVVDYVKKKRITKSKPNESEKPDKLNRIGAPSFNSLPESFFEAQLREGEERYKKTHTLSSPKLPELLEEMPPPKKLKLNADIPPKTDYLDKIMQEDKTTAGSDEIDEDMGKPFKPVNIWTILSNLQVGYDTSYDSSMISNSDIRQRMNPLPPSPMPIQPTHTPSGLFNGQPSYSFNGYSAGISAPTYPAVNGNTSIRPAYPYTISNMNIPPSTVAHGATPLVNGLTPLEDYIQRTK